MGDVQEFKITQAGSTLLMLSGRQGDIDNPVIRAFCQKLNQLAVRVKPTSLILQRAEDGRLTFDLVIMVTGPVTIWASTIVIPAEGEPTITIESGAVQQSAMAMFQDVTDLLIDLIRAFDVREITVTWP